MTRHALTLLALLLLAGCSSTFIDENFEWNKARPVAVAPASVSDSRFAAISQDSITEAFIDRGWITTRLKKVDMAADNRLTYEIVDPRRGITTIYTSDRKSDILAYPEVESIIVERSTENDAPEGTGRVIGPNGTARYDSGPAAAGLDDEDRDPEVFAIVRLYLVDAKRGTLIFDGTAKGAGFNPPQAIADGWDQLLEQVEAVSYRKHTPFE